MFCIAPFLFTGDTHQVHFPEKPVSRTCRVKYRCLGLGSAVQYLTSSSRGGFRVNTVECSKTQHGGDADYTLYNHRRIVPRRSAETTTDKSNDDYQMSNHHQFIVTHKLQLCSIESCKTNTNQPICIERKQLGFNEVVGP